MERILKNYGSLAGGKKLTLVLGREEAGDGGEFVGPARGPFVGFNFLES